MKTYTITLTRNVKEDIFQVGQYVALLTATNEVRIRVPEHGINTKWPAGVGEPLPKFNHIEIVSDTDQTIVLAISETRIDDNRLVGDVKTSEVRASTLLSYGDMTILAGSSDQIAWSNSSRKAIAITSHPSNAAMIRIAESGPDEYTGIPLMPGEMIVLDVTCNLYAYNTGASDADVSADELQ